MSLKGRFSKPVWDWASPIALSRCVGDFLCTEQGWGVEISLLFPDRLEWVSIVVKCGARDFSCCLVKTWMTPFSVLSMSWCAYGAQARSLPRFPVRPQKQPDCTSRGSGCTGYSFGFSDMLSPQHLGYLALCRHAYWLFQFPALGFVAPAYVSLPALLTHLCLCVVTAAFWFVHCYDNRCQVQRLHQALSQVSRLCRTSAQ